MPVAARRGAATAGGPVTRIVAGTAGGRRLAVPSGSRTRPTAERTREAMFSTLGSLADLDGAHVLDLFAGSGALGLEALSRGAALATLVEQDATVLRTLRANVRTLGLPGAEVVASTVERFLGNERPESSYDVVMLDPPYSLDVAPLLTALVDGHWLAGAAVVVVERSSRDPDLSWPPGLLPVRSRRYGDTTLWYAAPL